MAIKKEPNNEFEIFNLGYDVDIKKTPRNIPVDILKWGTTNLLPEKYLRLYYLSPTQSGITNKKAQMTAGSTYAFSTPEAEEFAKKIGFSQLFHDICLDYWLYNNISLQIVTTTFTGIIDNILYQDPTLLRKTLDPDRYAVSTNWTAQMDSSLQIYKLEEIFYVNKYNGRDSGFMFVSFTQPGVEYYSYPSYFASINSIESEIQLIQQQLNFINNNFSLTKLIKLPSTVSKTQLASFKEQMKNMSGPANAGKMLAITADGTDAIEILSISEPIDFSGIKLGLDICRESIIIGHSLPSPTIIGLAGGQSLGGDGSTIEAAYNQFFNSQVVPVRKKLVAILEDLFDKAGFATKINIIN